MSSSSNFALIPARGGSKGVHKKNLQIIDGIPLVARAILSCRNSQSIDEIVVSSDDSEILQIAKELGAIPLLRPSNLSTDVASTDPVINHAIDYVINNIKSFSYLTLIQATSPFIDPSHIDLVFNHLVNSNHDSTFAAQEVHHFLWSKTSDEYHLANFPFPFSNRPRRQDLKNKQYLELGSIYCMEVGAFKATQSRFCSKPSPVTINNAYDREIDNYQDLVLARIFQISTPLSSPLSPNINTSNLQIIVSDFDGVLTNNLVSTSSQGDESIVSSKYDSYAFKRLKDELGVQCLLLSSELSATHLFRAKKMKLDILQTSESKSKVLQEFLNQNGIRKSGCSYAPSIIYLGNDLNDYPVRSLVDLFICPRDSNPIIKAESDIVLRSTGGSGVVSELVSYLLDSSFYSNK